MPTRREPPAAAPAGESPTQRPTAEIVADLVALAEAQEFTASAERLAYRLAADLPAVLADLSTLDDECTFLHNENNHLLNDLTVAVDEATRARTELERLRVDYRILWGITLGRTDNRAADDATLLTLAERAQELAKLSVTAPTLTSSENHPASPEETQ